VSNNRQKVNLLAGLMAMTLLLSIEYALYYFQQPIMAQSSTSTSELSLNNKTDIDGTANVLNTTDKNASTTNFLTYQNSTYGVTVQYPSDWIYVGHDASLRLWNV
jgi:hypothetical protein